MHKSSKSIGENALSSFKPLNVLVRPNVAEAEKAVKEAVSQRKTLLVVGNCWVHYLGRAKSKLEPGERILIIKEDGSLLVHRSVGYEPVNWQPPGCIFNVQAKDALLEIRAVRRKPAESVKVFFDRIQMVSALSLQDSGEFSLYASEEDMQKAILCRPSLLEEGFKPISYEKRVQPGFVDIYGVDKDGKLVVVEIKRKKAGKEAAIQLAKYIDAVKSRADREVRGILAAPSIAKEVQRTLETLGLEFKPLDPKKCAETLRRSETAKLAEFFVEK
ncbi:endonuclease NucS [Candidatus Bathyarchaeota archaeon CG07_land_8_20_14_0_80_47_9]|nr:MAG: endonuclease NucS [Candidatus Bathyarchaeota archaeon CG07_land_8_20_14_0_80_47_9]